MLHKKPGNYIFKKIELKAVPKYTIEYDKNGGTFGPLPTEFIPGVSGDINLTSIGANALVGTRRGHTFVRWDGILPVGSVYQPLIENYYTEMFGGDASTINSGVGNAEDWDKCDDPGHDDFDRVIKLKAQFTPNNYQVEFDSNLGAGSPVSLIPADNTWIVYNDANTVNNITLPTLVSDASKTFKGWAFTNTATAAAPFSTFDATGNQNPVKLETIVAATEVPGAGATITSGVSPLEPNPMVHKITLYAIWETPQYNVTFDLQGKGTNAPAGQNLAYGSLIAKPVDPTTYGYYFEGWYREKECSRKWDFTTDTVMGATTLYANWVANDYTVKFDANAPSDFTKNPVTNPSC